MVLPDHSILYFFFINATATTEIYTLSLHDALPISFDAQSKRERSIVDRARAAAHVSGQHAAQHDRDATFPAEGLSELARDRKSTRLNSSHMSISYAVFCLKKKREKR